MFGGGGGGGGGGEARILYHGTSLEAILAIQESGFRIDLSGTNAGAALGPGVYVTTTLQKALNYAKREGVPGKEPNPAAGGVFELEVNLGRCYTVRSAAGPGKTTRAERTGWASQGYDSAWAAAGIIGEMEENCVREGCHASAAAREYPGTGPSLASLASAGTLSAAMISGARRDSKKCSKSTRRGNS